MPWTPLAPRRRPALPGRRRFLPLLVVATALVAAVASGGPASGAAAGGRGEQDADIGPRTAPVHPGYSTPERARASVKAAHEHSHGGAAPRTASGGTTTASGDTTTASADTVTTLDPAVFGSWETLAYDLPLRAVHATALKNGKVLLIAGSGNVAEDNVIGRFKAYVLEPDTGALTSVPVPYDAFCAFHVVDANGDVLVFGGTTKYKSSTNPWVGSNSVYKFVVDTETWVALPSMADGRWYPGGTMDGDGRVYVYSGYTATGAVSTQPEMYDPATNAWTRIAGRDLPLYPGLHTAADGRLFYSGAHYGSSYATVLPKLFHPITGAKVGVSGTTMDLSHRNMAMSALVGSADQQVVWVAGGGFPAVGTSYFVDLDASAPAEIRGPALPAPKAYVSMSHLPDLTTVETGGGAGTASPVYETSILEPATRTLTPMAPHTVPRTYHSSSLTTRDGRVLTFGGDPDGGVNFVLKVEVFSPPYLFQGPRPVLSSAPTELRYGGAYALEATATDASLAYASLLRPGSATHATDSNQRSLRLATRPVTGGVEITLPVNPHLAPPGWYYLSVVDSQGRPSVARMVHLTGGADPAPPAGDTTAPTVTGRTPAAAATGVDVASDVTATFSEPVSGVSGTTFVLRSGATSVPATVTYASGRATLDPDVQLAGGTTYTVALTSGIADAAGNPLAAQEWSFTTTAGAATTRTLVVPAQADTMVKQASPKKAYGSATTLWSDAQELSTTGSAVHSHLRFEVTGLAPGETVTSAQLSLRTTPTDGGTSDGPAVWRTADTTLSGAESMTWRSGRPARTGSAAVGDLGSVGHDVRVGATITGVTGNGLVSLELAPESSNGLGFRSSEHATAADRPQLVLTVSTG